MSAKATLNSVSDTLNLITIIISVKEYKDVRKSLASHMHFLNIQVDKETQTRTGNRYTLQLEYTSDIICNTLIINQLTDIHVLPLHETSLDP